MRAVLAFLLFMVSQPLWAANHHIPVDADDHGPNLPSVGSSLFDKVFSAPSGGGGAAYDVPFPLDRLMGRLIEMDASIEHTMFPFSRSLQRPQDLSYDPILNPRIVFTPSRDNQSLLRGKIFFGYVKARDQLEVISYNDEAGRFEYQIVTEYSRAPKVFYADRGKCLSCHQGQAPIFSTPGWSDSTSGFMGKFVLSKLGLEDNTVQNRKIMAERLFGPINSHDGVAMVDAIVRESNRIALDERIWLHGCGEDRKCRLGLLLMTLSPNSSSAIEFTKYVRQVMERTPFKNQKYYHSFLTPSSFGAPGVVKKYGSVENVVNNPQAILDLIGLLYNLSPTDNPATPRPETLVQRDLVSPLTGFLLLDKDVIRREIPDPEKVAEILIRLHDSGSRIFDGGAINKIEIMRALLAAAGSPKADDYGYWLSKPTPKKVLFEGPLPPVFRQGELNLFSRHCAKCHAAGLMFPPQFLLGGEGEVVEKMRQLKGRILFKLQNGLMPPNREERDVLVSSGDYDRMLRYVNSL